MGERIYDQREDLHAVRQSAEKLYPLLAPDVSAAERRRLAVEAFAAAKERIVAEAISAEMPDDLRARAKAWGVEAVMEVVWHNAYLRGYRAALTDAPEDGEQANE